LIRSYVEGLGKNAGGLMKKKAKKVLPKKAMVSGIIIGLRKGEFLFSFYMVDR
jgi:hypothetical protein